MYRGYIFGEERHVLLRVSYYTLVRYSLQVIKTRSSRRKMHLTKYRVRSTHALYLLSYIVVKLLKYSKGLV